jgi:osmoprotectant transport system ATP-binding protein
LIEFEQVTKRFPDGTVVLEDLNLHIPAGKITVLVGPSGCGKTTTLRMINRMVEPTSGRVVLDGKDVREADPPVLRRHIGYVIQQAGLFPHRTIVDNVATVPFLLGWPRRKARDRAMELLEVVGLPAAFAKRYPYQLSGGQQQRVGVARALAADPPVLLMDEPFSAVDPVVRGALQAELLRLQAELRKTIVFVTHDIDEAIKLGDMVGLFRVGGGLVQYDTPQRLLSAPADDFVAGFLGVDRGIRGLSFLAASSVPLDPGGVVTLGAAAPAADGTEWLLVVDGERTPVGWLAPSTAGSGASVGREHLVPLGRTFRPDEDSLRVALDSAVLSPAGRAVAVDADGHLIGTADQKDLATAIHAGENAGENTAGENIAEAGAGRA